MLRFPPTLLYLPIIAVILKCGEGCMKPLWLCLAENQHEAEEFFLLLQYCMYFVSVWRCRCEMYKHISIRIICICSFLTQALIHRTFIINTVAIAENTVSCVFFSPPDGFHAERFEFSFFNCVINQQQKLNEEKQFIMHKSCKRLGSTLDLLDQTSSPLALTYIQYF